MQGDQTRSHPELGRQTPQPRWYYASRPGRVGRCQASQADQTSRRRFTARRVPRNRPPVRRAADKEQPKSLFHKGRTARPRSSPNGSTNPLPITRHRMIGTAGPGANARTDDAGWSSPVARQAHNLKAAGSNPAPATKIKSTYKQNSPPLAGHLRSGRSYRA